eukprot:TRINITY_DN2982_c0_g1_i3.p1 TRINITY_DN2982_c0_g1~~TRINITY_DN2982_c0_g1_i3.p1  ORF type:complete len:377 (-),score=95.63 TRINITY_DN2982_c0_g1_i3:121-1191(-)
MSIHLILGPTFAGKTDSLIKIAKEKQTNKNVMMFASKQESKLRSGSSSMLVSSTGQKYNANYVDNLGVCRNHKDNTDCFCIDNGHFFENIVEISDYLANNGKEVYITAITGDYNQNVFANIKRLISKCETLEFLAGKCEFCDKEAIFSKSEATVQLMAGLHECYQTVCGEHRFGIRKMGKLTLIMGPMFAGKTTKLIEIITQKRNETCENSILVKYSKDQRYGLENECCTHDGKKLDALAANYLCEIKERILNENVDCVGIDEGQFFPDLTENVVSFLKNGINVFIGGLDGSFLREPIGSMVDLLPFTSKVIKLKAKCHYCLENAQFSKRIVECNDVVCIGGAESYVATCRSCFHK